ncbi:hypothetical protein [Rhodococcus sp. LW-XY12]|uniref:hypothetical protein n=1 Tax=Rhodococcus sp. LW-XY12 TaxID=2856851 RepID=UPI001C588255|nr:hypothetical protein [Rhodococcus sp. LW-XY12]QXU53948.1 hypothetical protein KXC42_01050 [Rhodococcus sp. LW-XY12]
MDDPYRQPRAARDQCEDEMQEMGAVRAFHIIDGDLLDRRERLRGRVRRLRMPVELLMRVILWRVLLLRVRIRLLILLLCIQVLLVLGASPLLFFERDLLMVVSKTLSFGLALLLFLPGAKTVQLLEFPWLEIPLVLRLRFPVSCRSGHRWFLSPRRFHETGTNVK